MKRQALLLLLLLFLLCPCQSLAAEFGKTFKTNYSTIHYSQDKDIDDFLWHLGGQRLDIARDATVASNRVDRIVERVEAILDMRPEDLKFDIYLHRAPLKGNRVAFYDNAAKSVHVSIENATDGIVAHEIAHVIINKYFVSPPSKIQEILTQYVDKYLWSDY